MPLLPILRTNPAQIEALHIQQVVALCGNGRLVDNTECSQELREYLEQARSEKLFEYLDACLESGFEKSGLVLQDLVNELGRRLDYKVENGPYQGRPNAIGFDGIWWAPNGHSIVVEVKTTDAYRINLDTIADYRERLIDTQRITKMSSILIVVGRQDTGDLEAQIRGSKHAWDVRLISVDALLTLVKLKEETEEETVTKIRDLLIPFEYTRLDRIIDVAFTAARDAGAVIREEQIGSIAGEEADDAPAQVHTRSDVLAALRQRIVRAVGSREGTPLIRKSAALYWSADRRVRVVCSISKRYPRGTYWYAYHPHWDRFLADGEKGYYVLGCVDRGEAFALPFQWIHERLQHLYTTERDEGRSYWHVHLEEVGTANVVFKLFKLGQRVAVAEFRVGLD